jgi:CRP-like cAMP-binding protein
MDPALLARLTSCPLFRNAEARRLEQDMEASSFSITVHNREELLFVRGHRLEELLVILSGRLRGVIDDPEGHTMTVETLRAPEAIATAIMFAPKPYLPVTLYTVTDVELFRMPRDSFLEICRHHPTVLRGLLADMGARTAFLANRMRFAVFTTIRQKLASYLIEQSEREPGRRAISVSKKDLAELFGVNRPSLSRVFAQLCAEGVLSPEGRAMRIEDRRRLERIARTADRES